MNSLSPPSPAYSIENSCAEPRVGSKRLLSVLRETSGRIELVTLLPSDATDGRRRAAVDVGDLGLLEAILGADAGPRPTRSG
jgi:hypothetical protein